MHNKNLLFVLNCGRSGSTLLKNMLDQHTAIFAPAELHLWHYDHLTDLTDHLRFTSLAKGLEQALTKLHQDEAKAKALVQQFTIEKTPIPMIMDHFMTHLQEGIMVDKSPSYPYNRATLDRMAAYGAASGVRPKYLFLHRHPIDVFQSMLSIQLDKTFRVFDINGARMRRRAIPPTSNLFLAYEPTSDNPCQTPLQIAQSNYCLSNEKILTFLETIPAEDRLTVRYEDLILDPVGELARICTLLGIEPEPNMLHPFSNKSGAVRVANEVGDIHYEQYKALDTSLVEGWRQQYTKWAEATYTAATLRIAERLGYELPAAPCTAPATLSQAVYHKRGQGLSQTFIEISRYYDASQLPFEEARFAQALETCLHQHKGLRCQPIMTSKGLYNYYPAVSTGLPFAYVDALSSTQLETHKRQLIEQYKMSVPESDAPRFFVWVIKQQENRYEVVYLFDHFIADGYSIQLFHRLLWDTYQGQPTKATPLVAQLQQHYQTATPSLYSEVLSDYHRADATSVFTQQTLQTNTSSTVQTVQTKTLMLPITKNPPFTFHNTEALYSLYRAVAQLYETDRVSISLRNNRRTVYGTTYLGFVAGDYPLCVAVDSETTADTFRRDLKQYMRQLPLKSIAYDELFLDDQVADLPHVCGLRYNYFPMVGAGSKGAFSETKGLLHRSSETPMDYLVDVLVRDYQTHLQLIVRYNATLIAAPKIELLCNYWTQWLLGALVTNEQTSSPSTTPSL